MTATVMQRCFHPTSRQAKLDRLQLRDLCKDSLNIGQLFDRKRSLDQSLEDEEDLNRSINRLIEEDDVEETRSARLSPVRATAPPKLTRSYSIATTGFQHLLIDIHATHQLDLHAAVNRKKDCEKPVDEAVDSPGKWLKRLAKERKELKAGDAFATAAAEARPAPDAATAARKQWALLRHTALLLSALKAKRAATPDLRHAPAPASPLRSHWQSNAPSFDVQAFVEQTFMQQAQAGELDDLHASFSDAYLDNSYLAMMQQQQLYYEQQLQHFLYEQHLALQQQQHHHHHHHQQQQHQQHQQLHQLQLQQQQQQQQ